MTRRRPLPWQTRRAIYLKAAGDPDRDRRALAAMFPWPKYNGLYLVSCKGKPPKKPVQRSLKL